MVTKTGYKTIEKFGYKTTESYKKSGEHTGYKTIESGYKTVTSGYKIKRFQFLAPSRRGFGGDELPTRYRTQQAEQVP